jgi:hypothetical protein
MGNSFSKKIVVNNNVNNLNELVENTFSEMNWRYKKINSNYYEANVNMGMKSWGEDFSVNINSANELIVKSKLKFGLVDWGKNQNNVQIFESTLLNISQLTGHNNLNSSIKKNNNVPPEDESFINKITKLHKLFIAQILTQEEFQIKKKELISNLDISKMGFNKEDFLISLISLKTNNILSQDEILLIKNNLTDRG